MGGNKENRKIRNPDQSGPNPKDTQTFIKWLGAIATGSVAVYEYDIRPVVAVMLIAVIVNSYNEIQTLRREVKGNINKK